MYFGWFKHCKCLEEFGPFCTVCPEVCFSAVKANKLTNDEEWGWNRYSKTNAIFKVCVHHQENFQLSLLSAFVEMLFGIHTQAIFTGDEHSEHAKSLDGD